MRFDVSEVKPMQVFRSMDVFPCRLLSLVHMADRVEVHCKAGWVHVLEMLAPPLSASAMMTRQRIRT